MKGPLNKVVGNWVDKSNRDPIYVGNLDPELRTVEEYGNPQDAYQCIRVAGTNGKGSTTRMIAWTLQNAGYSVGIMSNISCTKKLTDTISIDGEDIEVDVLRDICEEVDSIAHPEIEPYGIRTVAALEWFRRNNADVVVLESGVGSKYDATNIVGDDVYVVTNIGEDHAESFKHSIPEDFSSASEKSEVFLTGASDGSIELMSEHTDSKIREVDETFELYDREDYTYDCRGINKSFQTNLTLGYQEENINTSWSALKHSSLRFELQDFIEMLSGFRFEGRGELVRGQPNILLDGAHNIDGIESVSETLGTEDSQIVSVFTALSDKRWRKMFEMVDEFSELVVTTNPQGNSRTENIDSIKSKSDLHVEKPLRAVEAARDNCPDNGLVIITGSLYMIREIRGELIDRYESC